MELHSAMNGNYTVLPAASVDNVRTDIPHRNRTTVGVLVHLFTDALYGSLYDKPTALSSNADTVPNLRESGAFTVHSFHGFPLVAENFVAGKAADRELHFLVRLVYVYTNVCPPDFWLNYSRRIFITGPVRSLPVSRLKSSVDSHSVDLLVHQPPCDGKVRL